MKTEKPTYKGIDRKTVDAMIRIGKALERLDESFFFIPCQYVPNKEVTAKDVITEALHVATLSPLDNWDAAEEEIERLVFSMFKVNSGRVPFAVMSFDSEVLKMRTIEQIRDDIGRKHIGPSENGYQIFELAGSDDFRKKFLVCKK